MRKAQSTPTPQPNPEPLGNFSIDQVAEYLALSRSEIERMLHGGEFGRNWWRRGRKYIIPKINVFAYEQRQQEKALGNN
jgi:excisionase family DNA binding protein